MDEILSENRSNKPVWTVAIVAVLLFVAVMMVTGSFGTAEIAATVTN